MELSQTTSMSTLTGSPSNAATSKAVISSDFETFLKMLTVQMENQDPLNPADSSDYAVQLATFSQVEQSVLTNDLLAALSLQMTTTGMAQMANWVGNEALASVPGHFDGAPITIAPDPPLSADRVELVVTNENGTEVQRSEIPKSTEPLDWAGVANNGTPFPEGIYAFNIVSYAGDEILSDEPAGVYSRVQEVRINGGETILILQGGVGVPASQVTALRDPMLS